MFNTKTCQSTNWSVQLLCPNFRTRRQDSTSATPGRPENSTLRHCVLKSWRSCLSVGTACAWHKDCKEQRGWGSIPAWVSSCRSLSAGSSLGLQQEYLQASVVLSLVGRLWVTLCGDPRHQTEEWHNVELGDVVFGAWMKVTELATP